VGYGAIGLSFANLYFLNSKDGDWKLIFLNFRACFSIKFHEIKARIKVIKKQRMLKFKKLIFLPNK
jgi:hypothetical protein